jgi:ubiquinone/menaquinone biosynthesis C-methylase UbiE
MSDEQSEPTPAEPTAAETATSETVDSTPDTPETTPTNAADVDDPVRTTIEAYESNPETYDYLNETVVAEMIGDTFREHLPGPRVLDAGCGPGSDLAAFETAGLDPVGLDRTEPFLREAASETAAASLVRADLRAFPFDAASFDGVWCCAALLHLPREDASSVLTDAARVLRSGGALFVSVKRGQSSEYTTDEHGNERFFTKFEPAELHDLLEDAGFSVAEELDQDEWMAAIATLD